MRNCVHHTTLFMYMWYYVLFHLISFKQEAVLDATLIFDDGTSLSLHDVSTNDYTVAVTTLDPNIALESPDSMQVRQLNEKYILI